MPKPPARKRSDFAALYGVSAKTVDLWREMGAAKNLPPPYPDPEAMMTWWGRVSSRPTPAGINAAVCKLRGTETAPTASAKALDNIEDFRTVIEASRQHFAYIEGKMRHARESGDDARVIALSREMREAEKTLRDTEKAGAKICVSQGTLIDSAHVRRVIIEAVSNERRMLREKLIAGLVALTGRPKHECRDIIIQAMEQAAIGVQECMEAFKRGEVMEDET